MQGCGTIEAMLADDEVAASSSDLEAALWQESADRAAAQWTGDEGALPLRPRRTAKRPAAKPRTELARASSATEPTTNAPAPETFAAVIEAPPAIEATPTEAPPPPNAAPVKLIGLDENELTALLGTPNDREEQAPGKLWRYRLANCTISISLYPEVRTLKFRALSYEVKSNDDSAVHKYGCFSQRELNALAK